MINCEKRRKDHWQMFGHHILTITLIVGSYAMNFTSVGVLIHCLMDFCDILLPVSHFIIFFSTPSHCNIHSSSPKCFAISPSPLSATSHSSSSSSHGSSLDKSVSSSSSAAPISTCPNSSPLNGLPNKADSLPTGHTLALSPCSPSSGSSRPRGFTWLALSLSAWYEVWVLKTREVMMSPKRTRWSKCQRV